MSQDHHIIALALAHWPYSPGAEAARSYLHNTAEKLNRPFFFPDVDKGEPHRLWPAKKIAAFFLALSPLLAQQTDFLTEARVLLLHVFMRS